MRPPAYAATTTQSNKPSKPKEETELPGIAGTCAGRRRPGIGRHRPLPQLELVREPELSVVLFRRLGWDAAQYRAWSDELLREHGALVVPTRWYDETVARLAFLHPNTTLEIVDEILATTR